jgi:hypothetical protein
MSNDKMEMTFRLRTKKDVAGVKKILDRIENEAGISIDYELKEEEDRIFPGLTTILIAVGKEFAGYLVKKYGSKVTELLEEKLGVDKEEGEQIKEVGKSTNSDKD